MRTVDLHDELARRRAAKVRRLNEAARLAGHAATQAELTQLRALLAAVRQDAVTVEDATAHVAALRDQQRDRITRAKAA